MKIIVKSYSLKARLKINEILLKYLSDHDAAGHINELLVCLDELLKNAIKGNYKYVLIQKKIMDTINQNEKQKVFNEIISSRDKYNSFVLEHVNMKQITEKVRTALSQESNVIKIIEKCLKQNRKITPEEKNIINSFNEYLEVRRLADESSVFVEMRISTSWNSLNIEISNNAPILDTDLIRIQEKRDEFKKFADKGEEGLFFINHIDEMDGGHGLGYAMIDSSLRNMKFIPSEVLHIISISNTTVLLLLNFKQMINNS